MDAGLVSERVTPDDCLIGLRRPTNDLREQAARGINLLGAYAGFVRQLCLAYSQRHHDLFERSVSGTLADAVDGALHLSRTRLNSSQTVRDGQPEIIVAMHGNGNFLDSLHSLANG